MTYITGRCSLHKNFIRTEFEKEYLFDSRKCYQCIQDMFDECDLREGTRREDKPNLLYFRNEKRSDRIWNIILQCVKKYLFS